MAKSIEDIKKLIEQKRKLEDSIQAVIKEVFPVGSIVGIKKGRAYIRAKIVEYTSFGDVFIRNIDTGKTYRLSNFWLYGCGEIL